MRVLMLIRVAQFLERASLCAFIFERRLSAQASILRELAREREAVDRLPDDMRWVARRRWGQA